MEIFKVFGPYLAINFETLRLEKTPICGIFCMSDMDSASSALRALRA